MSMHNLLREMGTFKAFKGDSEVFFGARANFSGVAVALIDRGQRDYILSTERGVRAEGELYSQLT